MRLFIYTVFFILFASLLNASDLPSSKPVSASDINISTESATTVEIEDVNASSWFFYLDFINHTQLLYEHHVLTHVDTAYLYGTDAVIVVGSGIDYTLYRLLNFNQSVLQPDANLTLDKGKKEKEDEKNFFKKGIASKSIEKLEQYLSSQEGKAELPKQLYSADKRKGERTYLISEWFGDKNIKANIAYSSQSWR